MRGEGKLQPLLDAPPPHPLAKPPLHALEGRVDLVDVGGESPRRAPLAHEEAARPVVRHGDGGADELEADAEVRHRPPVVAPRVLGLVVDDGPGGQLPVHRSCQQRVAVVEPDIHHEVKPTPVRDAPAALVPAHGVARGCRDRVDGHFFLF